MAESFCIKGDGDKVPKPMSYQPNPPGHIGASHNTMPVVALNPPSTPGPVYSTEAPPYYPAGYSAQNQGVGITTSISTANAPNTVYYVITYDFRANDLKIIETNGGMVSPLTSIPTPKSLAVFNGKAIVSIAVDSVTSNAPASFIATTGIPFTNALVETDKGQSGHFLVIPGVSRPCDLYNLRSELLPLASSRVAAIASSVTPEQIARAFTPNANNRCFIDPASPVGQLIAASGRNVAQTPITMANDTRYTGYVFQNTEIDIERERYTTILMTMKGIYPDMEKWLTTKLDFIRTNPSDDDPLESVVSETLSRLAVPSTAAYSFYNNQMWKINVVLKIAIA